MNATERDLAVNTVLSGVWVFGEVIEGNFAPLICPLRDNNSACGSNCAQFVMQTDGADQSHVHLLCCGRKELVRRLYQGVSTFAPQMLSGDTDIRKIAWGDNRIIRAFERLEAHTIGAVTQLRAQDIVNLRGVGTWSLLKIRRKLSSFGLALKGETLDIGRVEL